VLLDFESRSRVDLSTCGGRRYWEDSSSEALVVVWRDTTDGSVGAWYPGQEWPHCGRVLAAHNAHGFDRFAADRYDFGAAGWVDTAQLTRKAGLPGALDALGIRWCDVPKDKVASKFTKALSSVKRPAHISVVEWRTLDKPTKLRLGKQPDVDTDALTRVLRYCASDVAIMAQTWERLRQWMPVDADAEALSRVINDRGVCFDSALAHRLLDDDARAGHAAVATAAAQLDITPEACRAAANSPKQFCEITGAIDAKKATVSALDHPLADARRALASIARGKLLAGLARVHADGRLRDTLLYYGAHTGRWSGKGMQLQNMPRPASPRFDDVDVDAYADMVLDGHQCDCEEVAMLVRATITASPGHLLAVCDYSSVEARATAWMAEDDAALAVFTSGRCAYRVAAMSVFGVDDYDAITPAQRQVGKAAELACGYQGGPNAFTAMAAVYRIDLSGLDTVAIVRAWRKLHAPIRSFWYSCEGAFRAALHGRATYAGPLQYVPSDDGTAVACYLPSGRPIVYQEARIGSDGRSLSYLSGKGRAHLYGGKLVENAVQAMCRDMMADAMLVSERAGLNPVLTVHDEIVCDVPEARAHVAYDELKKTMTTLPAWAAGLPVGAKGWVGFRYRK